MAEEDGSGLALPEGSEDGLAPSQAIQFAIGLLRRGDLQSAEIVLSRVLDIDPGNADALNFQAIVALKLGDLANAVSLSRRAVEAAPEHPGVRNNLANILLAAGDVGGAEEAYKTASTLDPQAAEPITNLATILRARGQYEAAEGLLRKALELDPELGTAHRTLARVLLATDRANEAIDHIWKATLYLQIESPYLLALAYSRDGQRDKAAAIIREWAESAPDNPEAQHLLAAFAGDRPPPRAPSDFVVSVFDRFARSFDSKLARLEYRAPQLVAAAVEKHLSPRHGELAILDAGCGTGLCGPLVRSFARHLAGVDLSAGMLAEAAKLHIYDRLDQSELTAFIARHSAALDLIISADTLCYFGALEDFAAGAFNALVAGGGLVFTVEALEEPDGQDFRLMETGRYAHAAAYVERVLRKTGFDVLALEQAALRTENLAPVAGHVFTARRDGPMLPDASSTNPSF